MATEQKNYDLAVIGAGSGGVRAARMAAAHGAKVALFEKKHLGGTCVNVGCVPKKLMVYAAGFRHEFEDAQGFGWSVGKTEHDWSKLISNKDTEIERLRGIYGTLLKDVEVFEGHARFEDLNTLEVDGKRIKADKILIATGGKPRMPDIPGKEYFSSSDDMFYLDTLPEHITIYGGGYIAAEFANIMHGLGSEVSLHYRGTMFLRHFDDDISLHLADEYRKQGINLQFSSEIEEIQKKENGRFCVKTTKKEESETDLVLAATGRIANIDDLNMQNFGFEMTDDGLLKVNEQFQTSHPHIYAVGDIINTMQLTPVAIAQAHYLADTLFAPKDQARHPYPNLECIPTAVFSNPPIGTVGMTEHEARDKFGDDNVICFPARFRAMKFTLPDRDEKTVMKLIVLKDSHRVVGIHMCGHDAPEIIQGFALAIDKGATKEDFDRMIGIHPTSGEEFFTMRTPSLATPAKDENKSDLQKAKKKTKTY